MNPLRHCCALGLATALACGEEVYRGEYVKLVVDPELDVCGDLVGHMDRFIAVTAEFLGVEIEGRRFTYEWASPERFAADSPCPDALGCAGGKRIISSAAPVDHELAHLVTFSFGKAPSFFMEGAAVAFETAAYTLTDNIYLPGDADILALLAIDGKLAPENYTLAGAYTRFLIDRHGLALYLEFYTRLERSDLLPQIEAAHSGTFGESLAETAGAFDAERRDCPRDRFRVKLFECSAPPIAWEGDSLLLRRSLACGEADVVGPFADSTARTYSTLEVATAGFFEISLASDEPGAVAALGGCGGCEDTSLVLLEANRDPVRRWLPAGQHYLSFAGDVQVATTMALRLERVDGP